MKVIAHRGGAGADTSKENTLAAIKAALKYGVDGVEIDVRVAPGQISGIPVLKHDRLLAEDKNLTTLESAIAAVNRKVPLYIEVKPDEPIDPVIGVIAQFLNKGWESTDFFLASYSQNTLQELHVAFPDINKVVIEKWSSIRAVLRARQLGTPYICMNQRWLWFGVINNLGRRGYKLSAYTVDNPAQAKRWQKTSLDAIITNFPDRFKG